MLLLIGQYSALNLLRVLGSSLLGVEDAQTIHQLGFGRRESHFALLHFGQLILKHPDSGFQLSSHCVFSCESRMTITLSNLEVASVLILESESRFDVW